jgi:hypothetical protein
VAVTAIEPDLAQLRLLDKSDPLKQEQQRPVVEEKTPEGQYKFDKKI